jgi:hypothetical protein
MEGTAIDYRYENGHFLVSTKCVTISNLDLFSNCEAEVNLGIRS